MKIGVDAGCLAVSDKRLKASIYQLGFNLFCELAKIKQKHQYLLYSFRPMEHRLMRLFGPQTKNIIARPRLGWRYFGLPLAILRERPNVFFGLSQALPAWSNCPKIVFVHDLAFERYPHCYPDSLNQLRSITKQAVNKATKIMAASKATKNDLINLYQVSSSKITVVYQGVNLHFKPQKITPPAKLYFLFVGALKRIKNIPFLLRAFQRFLKETGGDYQLYLAGGDLWLDPEILQTIARLKLEKNVRRLGFVPEKDLPALYSGALAFVSPAFYEGFGLTLLEAMACGCPVMTGNTGSQPEVVGSAGLLVDPENVSATSSAMVRLASSLSLRQKLSRAGLARARQFSWKKFSQKFLEIINQIPEV